MLTLSPYGVAQRVKEAKQKTATTKTDPYHRPAPSTPIKPTLPSVNRYQPNRIFLEQADSLYRTDPFEEKQIVSGHVKFRQGATWMYCDSAWYFPVQNRLNAFGHVRMEQGDTLFVYGHRLNYDGMQRIADLKGGPTQRKATLKNRKVTLTTDSLTYDLSRELGWYDCGGELRDDVNTLTSSYGQYSPATKEAEFFHNVDLVNRKDGYTMQTDTLYYNTDTHLARIESRTRITGKNDTIYTHTGSYNTVTGQAQLTSRSMIMHRDSVGNVVTLEGDSIIYEKELKRSRAYAYRDARKLASPMILTDTAHRTRLIGGYGSYDGVLKEAVAADYPLLIEYSQGDTIFLRADTIRSRVLKDTIGEYKTAQAYRRARVFRQDIQGIADSISYSGRDSLLQMYYRSVIWNGPRQVSGNQIAVHLNDSTSDWALLPAGGLVMEKIEKDFYNQLSGKKIHANFLKGTLADLSVEGNVMAVFLPQDADSTYSKLVKAESSFMTVEMDTTRQLKKMKMWPEVNGTVSPLSKVSAADKLLPDAAWLESVRPRREWLDGRWKWADDLGELSPELERYFSQARSNGFVPVSVTEEESEETASPSEGAAAEGLAMPEDPSAAESGTGRRPSGKGKTLKPGGDGGATDRSSRSAAGGKPAKPGRTAKRR